MDGKTVAFVFVMLLLCLHTADLRKLPPEHHAPTKKRHALPLLLTKDDDSGSSDESDSGPDNEVANERTFAPPARYPDHFLDYEAEPLFFQNGPPPDVDFIGIKHHFSNATNLAFPAYAHANRRHGKRSRNGPKHLKRHHSQKGGHKIKKPHRRHRGR